VTPEEKKGIKPGAKAPGGGDSAKGKAAESPAKKAEGEKPAAKKPAASKTAAKTTAAKKPAASETAAKKPAAKPKQPASKTRAKPKQKEEPVALAVRAKASYVRIAPRKARLIADQVRGLPLEDARTLLRFSPRTAARDIAKVIDSAAANAENNHDLIADDLRISDITVDEGPTLRRYRPRALGRATRINKRTSHIQVALTPEDT
jgi:large subunit ribosomal protein L22